MLPIVEWREAGSTAPPSICCSRSRDIFLGGALVRRPAGFDDHLLKPVDPEVRNRVLGGQARGLQLGQAALEKAPLGRLAGEGKGPRVRIAGVFNLS